MSGVNDKDWPNGRETATELLRDRPKLWFFSHHLPLRFALLGPTFAELSVSTLTSRRHLLYRYYSPS